MKKILFVMVLISLTVFLICFASTNDNNPRTTTSKKLINRNLPKYIFHIQLAEETSNILEISFTNLTSSPIELTLDNRHYSSWADVYVNGEHVYPSKQFPAACRACLPEKLIIAPHEPKSLVHCFFPRDKNSHTVQLKYWLSKSPTCDPPSTSPDFVSNILELQ